MKAIDVPVGLAIGVACQLVMVPVLTGRSSRSSAHRTSRPPPGELTDRATDPFVDPAGLRGGRGRCAARRGDLLPGLRPADLRRRTLQPAGRSSPRRRFFAAHPLPAAAVPGAARVRPDPRHAGLAGRPPRARHLGPRRVQRRHRGHPGLPSRLTRACSRRMTLGEPDGATMGRPMIDDPAAPPLTAHDESPSRMPTTRGRPARPGDRPSGSVAARAATWPGTACGGPGTGASSRGSSLASSSAASCSCSSSSARQLLSTPRRPAATWAPTCGRPAYLRDHLLPGAASPAGPPTGTPASPRYQFYMVLPSLAIALLSYVIALRHRLQAGRHQRRASPAGRGLGLRPADPPAVPGAAAAGRRPPPPSCSTASSRSTAATSPRRSPASSPSRSPCRFAVLLPRRARPGASRPAGTGRWAAVLLALTGLCHLIPLFFAHRRGRRRGSWSSLRPPAGPRSDVVARHAPAPSAAPLTAFWIAPVLPAVGLHERHGLGEDRPTTCDYLFRRQQARPAARQLAADRVGARAGRCVGRRCMSIVWQRRARRPVLAGHGASSPPSASASCPRVGSGTPACCPSTTSRSTCSAAVGVAELGRTLATLVRARRRRPVRAVAVAHRVVAALWPGRPGHAAAHAAASASARRGQLGGTRARSYDGSFLHDQGPQLRRRRGPSWNFTGYEGKAAYPEYHDIVRPWATSARTNGCGRAMWEHEEQHDRYGTPMALMLLPFWTDGCIGSMEGLYFEASATTPYHFLNQDELSTAPSNAAARPALRPGPPTADDSTSASQHLQMLGVRTTWPSPTHDDRPRPRPTRPHRGGDQRARGSSSRWPTASWSSRSTNEPAVVDGSVGRAAQTWLDDDRSTGTSTRTSWTCRSPPTARRTGSGSSRGETPRGRRPVAGTTEVTEHLSTGTDTISLRRRASRAAGAGEDVVLPELEGVGRRGPLPGEPQPDGRRAHQQPRRAALRLHERRLPRLAPHPARHRRAGAGSWRARPDAVPSRRAAGGPASRSTLGDRRRSRRTAGPVVGPTTRVATRDRPPPPASVGHRRRSPSPTRPSAPTSSARPRRSVGRSSVRPRRPCRSARHARRSSARGRPRSRCRP